MVFLPLRASPFALLLLCVKSRSGRDGMGPSGSVVSGREVTFNCRPSVVRLHVRQGHSRFDSLIV